MSTDIKKGLEEAIKAFAKKPNKHISEHPIFDKLSGDVKTFDKSVWKELRKLNETLERIENKLN